MLTTNNVNIQCGSEVPVWFYKPRGFWNLGDYLGIYMMSRLARKAIRRWRVGDSTCVATVGSIIDDHLPEDSVVWGSGLISQNIRVRRNFHILAVRGAYSRLCLEKQGVRTPAILGDPGLLMPRFFSPRSVVKKYKLGVIPHYMDLDDAIKDPRINEKALQMRGVKVLDIRTNDVHKFILEIMECEFIVSSSLHGIILSHAYGIPALWVSMSDKVIGEGFKFKDYFSSVGIPQYQFNIPASEIIWGSEKIVRLFGRNKSISEINNFDERRLIESCPMDFTL